MSVCANVCVCAHIDQSVGLRTLREEVLSGVLYNLEVGNQNQFSGKAHGSLYQWTVTSAHNTSR